MGTCGSKQLLLALGIIFQCALCFDHSLSTDCEALQVLYNATQGGNWLKNRGWTASQSTMLCCEWYGVTCEEIDGVQRVIELDLQGNNLNGTLPPDIRVLTQLVRLSLGGTENSMATNNIRGTLPVEWRYLGALEYLNVSRNAISGILPSEWGELRSLNAFDVSYCDGTGTLPREFAAWTNISAFIGASNNFYGVLPTEWAAWKGVEVLLISNNSLTGTLPSEWGSMVNITIFSCYENELGGTFPAEYESWTNILWLFAQRNRFSGSLPPQWSTWTQIEDILLHYNAIDGTLPFQYEAWTGIRSFYANDNLLTGPLPEGWSSWDAIEEVILNNNYLSGTLPTLYGNWSSARVLHLFGNLFAGNLPSEWARMSRITDVELQGNRLCGSLPVLWSEWRYIEKLFVSNNPISGTLPTEYGKWEKLSMIDICGLNIFGGLPSEWGEWSNLTIMAVCNNPGLNGTLPASWGQWDSAEALYLEGNAISGTIPSQWSRMHSLFTISLQDNFLVGSLDLCASNLQTIIVTNNRFRSVDSCMGATKVVSLDLRFNNFTSLPEDLITSGSYAVVDLRDCGLQLDISNIPMTYSSIPSLRLADNSGVYGRIEYLLASRSRAAYIDLDLSNTSITGVLHLLDPLIYDAEFPSTFPLANMAQLNVGFTNISGSLPWGWFTWRSGNKNELILGVQDTPNLRALSEGELPTSCEEIVANPHAKLPFKCDEDPISYVDPTYLCKPLQFPEGVLVIGLSAAYFQYRTCECAPGYSGTPPNCKLSSDSAEVLGLAVPFALLSAIIVALGVRRIYQWRVLASDLRRARAMLEIYVKESGSGTSNSAPLLGVHAITEDWVVPYDNLRIVKTIASGAQGQVSMALWNRTVVAVKEFFVSSEEERETLLGEAAMHIQLRHPNIVQLLGVCLEPACVVIEWMERGSLYDVIQNDPRSLPDIRQMALDVARGMLYLHSKGIIHRDLKSLNVMLDSRYTAKVGDFGTARQHSSNTTMTVGQGTVHWMAPEVIGSGHYSEKCDVYSFGILLWELLTFEVPFPEYKFSYQVMEAVQSGARPDIGRIQSVAAKDDMVDLMTRCWDADPCRRPCFDMIVECLESIVDPVT